MQIFVFLFSVFGSQRWSLTPETVAEMSKVTFLTGCKYLAQNGTMEFAL
jgi:hypothetical protein